MKNIYNKSIKEVYDFFRLNDSGLSDKQVIINRKKYGTNSLEEKESKSKARVFLEQFQDILVIILIISAIISLFTDQLESTIVIFAVISINAILGTYQYFKAEKSLESLKALSNPTSNVIRNSQVIHIDSKDLVVGDILLLKGGDLISADGRILKCSSPIIDESSLTGESMGVEKTSEILTGDNLEITEQKNMVFSGSKVISGNLNVVVTKVGMETEIGKIADLINKAKQVKTPLQNSLDEFSKKLAIIIIGICAVVFVLSVYRKISLMDSLMFAVALAVAAIPEALSTIVVIVLALGTQKMTIENAIIKELKAVEGLGCVNVICTDKTGTLTKNIMHVEKVYIGDKLKTPSKLIIHNDLDLLFLKAIVLCNDTTESDTYPNATELALLKMARNIGINIFDIRKSNERIYEIPFDSTRKLMSTLNKVNGTNVLFVKGASDILVNRCKYIHTSTGKREIIKGDIYDIGMNIVALSKMGLRVICIAYKEFAWKENVNTKDENNLVFLGLVGLIDPPRDETKKAIMDTYRAGIKPVMITGDHKLTALAIAKEVGIYKDGDLDLTGRELDQMSDKELDKLIEKISVYSRVLPEHKIRIVEAWQRKNGIVAFVGDGVNDAPAIRKANIGISMGLNGTEVSKEASEIILADNNYYTIIKAIRNGRNIYNNIQNAIKFLISGNLAAILMVIYTTLLALPIPFAPVHLLFINLLTDSIPAIAIGMEKSTDDLLNDIPRGVNDSFLSNRVMKRIGFEGVLIGIFATCAYYVGLKQDPYVARTMAFATICIARLFHSFNSRGNYSIFAKKIDNMAMVFSAIIGLILINIVMFVPFLQKMFYVSNLSQLELILLYIFAIIPTIIIQIIFIIKENKSKSKTM